MTREDNLTDATPTLSFTTFWEWLKAHPNCILRAGTREAVVFVRDKRDLSCQARLLLCRRVWARRGISFSSRAFGDSASPASLLTSTQ